MNWWQNRKMAKDLGANFEKYLTRLAPLPAELKKGASHKASVRSCLAKAFECYSLFETGSIHNDTGIKHYSDTDYFAVIPKDKLRNNSREQLRLTKEALQYTFWRTKKVQVNSPAVTIPFGTYRSEDLEITPCFFNGTIATPLGDRKAYGIPNGDGGWMLSSPQAHKAFVANHDRRLKGQLRPIIKLIKAWKFERNVPIASFYLELRIASMFASRKRIYLASDLASILNFLCEKGLARVRDPMHVSGYVHACSTEEKRRITLSKLETAASRAHKACYYLDRDPARSLHYWKLLFGRNFPSR
jgi:hypothetical protein